MKPHIIDVTEKTWKSGRHITALRELTAFVLGDDSPKPWQERRIKELQQALLARAKGKNFNLRSALVKYAMDVGELKLQAKGELATA